MLFLLTADSFDADFLNNIKGLGFSENRYQLTKFRKPSEEQFSLMEDQILFQFNGINSIYNVVSEIILSCFQE